MMISFIIVLVVCETTYRIISHSYKFKFTISSLTGQLSRCQAKNALTEDPEEVNDT